MRLIKILLTLIPCVLASSASSTVEYEWADFKIKFNKVYENPKEEFKRFAIFRKQYNVICDHNENETVTFKLGVNQNADLSDDEISATLKSDEM